MYIDFVLCNPPFFDSDDEEFNSQRMPSAANTAAPIESRCAGGELQFVQRLLNESEQFGDRVRVFSVMLGRKSTFVQLKQSLTMRSSSGQLQFIHTELCQGKTIRYGLAWTFDLTAAFPKVPCIRHKKEKSPLQLKLDCKNGRFRYTFKVNELKKAVLQALQDIQLRDVQVIVDKKNKCQLHVRSHVNTWSNQRRRKRMAEQEASLMEAVDSISVAQNGLMEDILSKEQQTVVKVGKRRRDSESGEQKINDFNSIDMEMNETMQPALVNSEELVKDSKTDQNDTESFKRLKSFASNITCPKNVEMFLLDCEIGIKEVNETITVEMRELDRCSNPNSTYQMFQYLKNQLQSPHSQNA